MQSRNAANKQTDRLDTLALKALKLLSMKPPFAGLVQFIAQAIPQKELLLRKAFGACDHQNLSPRNALQTDS